MPKILKLKNPIMIDGTEVKEIKYDFENLTAKDMIEAEKMMLGNGQISMTLEEMNYSWHMYLFASTAAKENTGSSINDYFRMKGIDAVKARALARNFLIAAEDFEESL